jgi:hypothetical protein
MDPRSPRAKEIALNNLARIEQFTTYLKGQIKPNPKVEPPKEDFFTIKEVDSPKTNLFS